MYTSHSGIVSELIALSGYDAVPVGLCVLS